MSDRPRRWTDEQLVAAVRDARTVADVCRAIGIVPRGGSYEVVHRHMARLGLDGARFRRGPRQVHDAIDDEAVTAAVPLARSLQDVCRRIGVPVGRHRAVAAAIRRLGLDTSHFVGQGWRIGSHMPVVRARPLGEVLVAGRLVQSTALRRRLIEEGLKAWCCEGCGRREWEGDVIPLELAHINGDRWDNRLENLRLLCPNCHARTPTYRGRNIGRRGAIG